MRSCVKIWQFRNLDGDALLRVRMVARAAPVRSAGRVGRGCSLPKGCLLSTQCTHGVYTAWVRGSLGGHPDCPDCCASVLVLFVARIRASREEQAAVFPKNRAVRVVAMPLLRRIKGAAGAVADVAGGAATAVGGAATVVTDTATGAVGVVFESLEKSTRVQGATMVASGAASATLGVAGAVVGRPVATAGAVVHGGITLAGDVVEGALNKVATGFHNLTVTEQEERAALLHALRTTKAVGPEGVAVQQRLAIAKCFHERLAAQVRWPVAGLDEFPFDIVVRIAELIEAKPPGPAPAGAPTITIYRPLATATGALTDVAEGSNANSRTMIKDGGLVAGLGGFAMISGEHIPIGMCPVIGHFVDVDGGSNAAVGIDLLTVDGIRRSQKNRPAAQALAAQLGGAPGARFISHAGPLIDHSGRAALVCLSH
eukprot:COSAG02_NODE_174_length_31243_cov_76.084543_13_plen_428_part_00